MLIRAAQPEDAAAIGHIRVAAWRAAYRGFMSNAYLASLDPAASLDRFRSALSAEPPPFTLRIAEAEAQPIAFSILGKPRYEADPAVAELWALNVHPSHWRKGAGQELITQALRDARQQGYTSVELWCICGNTAAERLYLACGFSPTGQARSTNALTGQPLHELGYSCTLSHGHPVIANTMRHDPLPRPDRAHWLAAAPDLIFWLVLLAGGGLAAAWLLIGSGALLALLPLLALLALLAYRWRQRRQALHDESPSP